MIETGTAKVGMEVISPDGKGKIVKVYDQDNVQVELESGAFCRCDLEKCMAV